MSEIVPETETTQEDPLQGLGGGISMSLSLSPPPSIPVGAPLSDRAKRAAAGEARSRSQSQLLSDYHAI